jgi:hypothetical protein
LNACPTCHADGGGVQEPVKEGSGMSKTGRDVRAGESMEHVKDEHRKALGELRAMKKPHLYAEGGDIGLQDDPTQKQKDTADSMRKAFHFAEGGDIGLQDDPTQKRKDTADSMRKAFHFAEGGEAHHDKDDIVDRIMLKKFSHGGHVANDVEPMVDGEEAQYDDLVKDDDLDFHYTGANSGDDLGDEREDYDRKDIVAKIMASRAKKGHMPRPA